MKANDPAKKTQKQTQSTELEDVKKKLKKRELETNILKKIIGEEDTTNNAPNKH